MPRPQRQRTVCFEPAYPCFSPEGTAPEEAVVLSVDEFETLRLVDFMKKSHEEAAKQMKISRTTVTEIYQSARYKVADSLVNGKKLVIAGGHYQLCGGQAEACTDPECSKRRAYQKTAEFPRKGTENMKIAIPWENEEIFQHFGHSGAFKLYEAENNAVSSAQVVPTNGVGHGALAQFLKEHGADVLICGGIGGGAKEALAQAGIQVYGGVSGKADEAAAAFLAGTLTYDPNVRCTHHQEHEGEHSCGSHEGHSCGGRGHSCGSHGCR